MDNDNTRMGFGQDAAKLEAYLLSNGIDAKILETEYGNR